MRYKLHLVELALQVERDSVDRGGVRQRRVLAVVEHAADRPDHVVALAEIDLPLRRRRVWLLQRASSVTEHKPASTATLAPAQARIHGEWMTCAAGGASA